MRNKYRIRPYSIAWWTINVGKVASALLFFGAAINLCILW